MQLINSLQLLFSFPLQGVEFRAPARNWKQQGDYCGLLCSSNIWNSLNLWQFNVQLHAENTKYKHRRAASYWLKRTAGGLPKSSPGAHSMPCNLSKLAAFCGKRQTEVRTKNSKNLNRLFNATLCLLAQPKGLCLSSLSPVVLQAWLLTLNSLFFSFNMLQFVVSIWYTALSRYPVKQVD